MKRRVSFQLSESSALVVYATMLITSFLLLACATPVLADGIKTIYVSVDFDQAINDEIETATLDEISTKWAKKFVTVANDRMGFLKWVNCESTDENQALICETAPAWKIKLTLDRYPEDKPKQREYVKLVHEVQLPEDWWPKDGRPTNNTEELSHFDLYKAPANKIPFSTPDKFEADIFPKFESASINEILESEVVKEHFFDLVPLADDVTVDPDREWVIIPVKRRDLKSDEDSILKFKFINAKDQEGNMKLKPKEIRVPDGEDNPNKEFVRGFVIGVEDAGMNGSLNDSGWNPDFKTIIPSVTEKKVYMDKYSPWISNSTESSNPDD